AREKRVRRDQRLDHGVVRVALLASLGEYALAREPGRLVGEDAILVDGVGNARLDAALLEMTGVRGPKLEVLASMARRGVDETGPGVLGDMLAFEQRHDKAVAMRVQGMGADHRGERIAA